MVTVLDAVTACISKFRKGSIQVPTHSINKTGMNASF